MGVAISGVARRKMTYGGRSTWLEVGRRVFIGSKSILIGAGQVD